MNKKEPTSAEQNVTTNTDSTDIEIERFIVSNTIIAEACNQYVKIYDSNEIPFSFIDFYITELSTYNHKFTPIISAFFKKYYGEQSELDTICNIFAKAMPQRVKKISKNNKQNYIILFRANYLESINYNINMTNEKFIQAKTATESMIEHLNASDELYTKKQLYKNYLWKKELINNKQNKTNKTVVSNSPPIINDNKQKSKIEKPLDGEQMQGKEDQLPQMQGRVIRIRIAKFTLPIKYPTSQTKCLIHSKIQLKKMLDAPRTINLMNDYRLVKVSFSTHYIDKRKRLLTPKKSKYSSFLDSF